MVPSDCLDYQLLEISCCRFIVHEVPVRFSNQSNHYRKKFQLNECPDHQLLGSEGLPHFTFRYVRPVYSHSNALLSLIVLLQWFLFEIMLLIVIITLVVSTQLRLTLFLSLPVNNAHTISQPAILKISPQYKVTYILETDQ